MAPREPQERSVRPSDVRLHLSTATTSPDPQAAARLGVVPRYLLVPALALGCALASCASPAANRTAASGAPADPAVHDCPQGDLAVTVDADLTIRVTNTATTACSIAGAPPVLMKVGRVDEPSPDGATVVLPAGATYVQPQVQVDGESACATPISAGLPGTGLWTITVDHAVVHPSGPAQLQRWVVNCAVVRLPAAHVDRAPASTGTAAESPAR
jgi:hypothetical protein